MSKPNRKADSHRVGEGNAVTDDAMLPEVADIDAAMNEISRHMLVNGMGMLHALYLRDGPAADARDVVAAVWCAVRATQLVEWRRARPARPRKARGVVH